MKKKILISFVIILLLFIMMKMRETLILNKINSSIEYFKNENNRYYLVSIKRNDDIKSDTEIYLNENLIRIIIDNSVFGKYCEWKNLENGEVNIYNISNKVKFEDEIFIKEDTLIGLPNFIVNMNKNNEVKLSQLLKVYYIIPITYNDKQCYKISTTSEIIIIEKDTYLPVYSSVKIVKSTDKDNFTENTYKFEVNTVTDEDVLISNFEEYEKII